ncbi:MAG: hypothetical protein ACOH19_12350 [Rhodoglobus sp.]
MVAQFLRLKLSQLGNRFSSRPSRLLGYGLIIAYVAVLAIGATVGLVLLQVETPEVARSIVIVFGSTVVLAFALLPFVFGTDDPMDPRRFALFGIPATSLSVALLAAAFVGVPTVIAAIFAFAQVGTWSRDAASTSLAIVAALIIIVTCVLAGRVSMAIASILLVGRRAREFATITLSIVGVALATGLAVMASLDWQSSGLPVVRRIAAIATWTPFGAAWSIPADNAVGNGEVGAKIAIALGYLLVLAVAWRALVGYLARGHNRRVRARNSESLGWFDRLPARPGWVIAARSLTYWARDPRYGIAIAVIPIVPIVVLIALLVGGVPIDILIWIPVPLMCLFLGWMLHNDVAYDSSAFWAHVSANTRGSADRGGRLIPALFVGAPLVILGSLATSAISSRWDALPALVGLSTSLLLTGLGVASVVSAVRPYPAVQPGDSPFAQPQVVGNSGAGAQALAFLVPLILSAPVGYLVFLGETQGGGWFLLALLTGVGIGAVALLIGVRWGGWLLDRRAPELLDFALRN